MSCPLGCAGPLAASDIALPEGPLLHCLTCGQLVSQCTRAELSAALRLWDSAQGTLPDVAAVARSAKIARRRLAAIARLLQAPPSQIELLDVGCSSGAFLMVAAREQFVVRGVEPSPLAAATARSAGLDVFNGLLHEAQFADASFDAVTLIELVEHVIEPIELFRECHRILRPNGVLLLNTPNAASWTARFMKQRWDGFSLRNMGGHISFFSARSMRVLAQKSGFNIAQIETRNVRFYEKRDVPAPIFRIARVGAELLNAPARLLGRGHDLLVILRKA